ncbi:MAG TPA: hypothetical protein VFC67_21115 [Prolixibacteraceae bacterium]|nr:hypothetical protein [Prolixibacteraceae bacterium]
MLSILLSGALSAHKQDILSVSPRNLAIAMLQKGNAAMYLSNAMLQKGNAAMYLSNVMLQKGITWMYLSNAMLQKEITGMYLSNVMLQKENTWLHLPNAACYYSENLKHASVSLQNKKQCLQFLSMNAIC